MHFPITNASVHTLKNGLKVILEADSSAPVISTQIWVKTGSIHEGHFLGAGISHLLEHMVFKGTEKYTSETLSQTVQAAGGQWNAYTTFDRTVYYIDGPSAGKETFLDVLHQMVFKPAFPEDEFEREKDVIRREIDMGMDDPDSRASRLLFETVFENDERRHPVIGHLELFNKVTHEDMVHYHATRYTTENAFVCISGDFVVEEVLEYLEELNKDIERSFTHPVQPGEEPEQKGLREASMTFAIPCSKYTLAWRAPSLDHPDSPALDLMTAILGSGKSSRLYRNVRDAKKLCLHIGAWSYIPSYGPGLLAVSSEVETENIADLEKAILEEIMHLLSDSLDKELEKAKRMTLSAQFKTLTTASGRASDLASNWNEARNLNFTRDYLSKIEAVSVSDIRRVAEQWMTGEASLSKITIYPEGEEGKSELQTQSKQAEREIVEHTLKNGLRLQICKDARVPLVSMQLAVKTGLPSESQATAGLNALLGTLLTKGTTKRSAERIADITESLGASISSSSGNNTTLVSASCLMPDVDAIMEILADCVINPAFTQEKIDREKEIQLNAIAESELDPASLAFKNLRSTMFGEQGYGINALGTKESVEALSRLSLVAQHKAYFNGSNMTLAIFGDVEPEHVICMAETYLSDLPEGKMFEPEPQNLNQATEKVLHLDKQQAVLTIGYEGVSLTNEDRHALDLLHAWCSDMAGPLFTRIREELGLAYYVSSTMFYGFDTGFFGFYMGTSPEQLKQAKEQLLEIISEIAENGMDDETLQRVKTSWMAKQALTNQSNGAMARLCTIDTLLGLGAAHFMKTAEEINALTVEDIKRVANKYFAQQDPTVVTVMPDTSLTGRLV